MSCVLLVGCATTVHVQTYGQVRATVISIQIHLTKKDCHSVLVYAQSI